MGSCLPLGLTSFLGGSQAVNIAIPTLVFSIALLEANPVGVGESGKGVTDVHYCNWVQINDVAVIKTELFIVIRSPTLNGSIVENNAGVIATGRKGNGDTAEASDGNR